MTVTASTVQTLPNAEVRVSGEHVAIPLPCEPPAGCHSVTACLARTHAGLAIMPALSRTLVWQRGESVPPLTLFARDIKAALPRGGKVWCVVRYGADVIAAGEVRVVP